VGDFGAAWIDGFLGALALDDALVRSVLAIETEATMLRVACEAGDGVGVLEIARAAALQLDDLIALAELWCEQDGAPPEGVV